MDPAELSSRYGHFHVPAFAVRVDGQDAVRELGLGISSVEVDRSLRAVGRFSFTVVGAYSIEKRAFLYGQGRALLDILRFGTPIAIALGYGSHKNLPTLLSGLITSIATQFPEGGAPELIISGYDHAFPMTLGKNTQQHRSQPDSAAIIELANTYNLDPDVRPTGEQHPQLEQNQESDFQFAQKLAERNHFELYSTPERTLRFAPPRDRESASLTLHWGASLLSFQPEANLAGQVTDVEVVGWDPAQRSPIIGKAGAADTSGKDSGSLSSGEQLRKALGHSVLLRLRQPVLTEAEARRRAQAILNECAKKFITGDAETIGIPDLEPDSNVRLAGLGGPFDKTYYIQQAIHRMDSNGYRTRIKVKETSL
ncbi:phage late control D family protein [Zoogloea sp.]|uniref:phage late control D family protein n=1 Tax=Zoogloea sp. TaxID=49181 RepID=UPI0035B1DE40